MSRYLPANTFLGKLRIIEVLDWYDGPRLFIAENASGNRYIAFWADETEDEDLWLYSSVSESRIDSLINGKCDLRSIYTQPEDECIFLIRLSHLDLSSSIEATTADSLDQSLLPPFEDFLVAEEGFFAENTFIDESASTQIHEIKINRPRSNLALAFDALASVATSWSRLIGCVLNEPPIPVGASVGSLVVELQTKAGPDLPALLQRIHLLVNSPTNETIHANFNYKECKLLELLLETLHKEKLTLSTKLDVNSDSPSLVLSHSITRDLRATLIDFNQQRIDSAKIPQADDLSKLFHMLELMKRGEQNLGYNLELSPRQVNYYKHAARVLDLLDSRDVMTSRGHYLVSLSHLVERYEIAMMLFESSPVGFAWLRYGEVETVVDLDSESALAFLTAQSINLSAKTIERRAQTLRYWVKAFQAQLSD